MQRARCHSRCANDRAGAFPSAACPANSPEQLSLTGAGLLWTGAWGDSLVELSLEFSPHLANSCGST